MKSRNYQKKLSMNKHLNYKETDSDWVESIPSEWKFIRGRFLFKAKKELNLLTNKAISEQKRLDRLKEEKRGVEKEFKALY